MSDKVAASSFLSYAHGTSPTPLLGQTIGDNLRATVERHGDREALVVCSQSYRATYRELWDATTRGRPRPARPRRAAGRPRRHLVAQPLRVGRRPVRHRPHRRHPRQHQPRLPGRRAGVRPPPVRRQRPAPCPRASARPTTRPCSTAVPAALPRPAARLRARRRLGGALATRRRRSVRRDLDRARGGRCSSTTPSTSSTPPARPASPRAPRSRTTTSSTTASSSARRWATPSTDRVCIPVPLLPLLRHGPGQPRLHQPRRLHGHPRRNASSPPPCWRPSQAERCTVPVRRADHVPRRARTTRASREFDCSSLRTGIMAGSPCPVELMKRSGRVRLHMPEVAIGYGMTETSPVSTHERPRRPAGTARRHGRPRACRTSRSASCDPATGAIVPRGTPGEFCTRGYSVMLGYWDDETATRAAIDAAGWMHIGRPRRDGRRRLRPHRRPAQGHDHPRRREHLAARDRGVPAHAIRPSARRR